MNEPEVAGQTHHIPQITPIELGDRIEHHRFTVLKGAAASAECSLISPHLHGISELGHQNPVFHVKNLPFG